MNMNMNINKYRERDTHIYVYIYWYDMYTRMHARPLECTQVFADSRIIVPFICQCLGMRHTDEMVRTYFFKKITNRLFAKKPGNSNNFSFALCNFHILWGHLPSRKPVLIPQTHLTENYRFWAPISRDA